MKSGAYSIVTKNLNQLKSAIEESQFRACGIEWDGFRECYEPRTRTLGEWIESAR